MSLLLIRVSLSAVLILKTLLWSIRLSECLNLGTLCSWNLGPLNVFGILEFLCEKLGILETYTEQNRLYTEWNYCRGWRWWNGRWKCCTHQQWVWTKVTSTDLRYLKYRYLQYKYIWINICNINIFNINIFNKKGGSFARTNG